MVCKVYAHVDYEGLPACVLPIEIKRPEDAQFGSVKQSLIQHFATNFPEEARQLDYEQCCFWNQDCCPIADRSSIALFAWEHNDFFLRPLPASSREDGAEGTGALASSQGKKGELSYYYAHNQQRQSLVSRPQGVKAAPPAAAKREPLAAGTAAAKSSGAGKFNARQSPFGTDINMYETITSYTWEDGGHEGDTVKVLVPLDGVGKLEPSAVQSHFGVRSFELLVHGYNGKNLRFACYKTHAEMKPEECKHVVRANRVNLLLRKAKEKDIWFDLFKKRAIGDDDEP